jgi:hypothetical protein
MAKILKKYFTKQNSNWTIQGVTYRRTNAPNLSTKYGLSKEIEKSRGRTARTRLELRCGDISGERMKWRWRGKWRARGAPSPCHGATRLGPHHHVVRWHGGSP